MTGMEAIDKILVIDDELSALKMLRLLLGADGYTVLTATNGQDGIEIFRKESPSIVLTDIRMPGLDGMEVLKRLKEIDPSVEVIMVTGHGDMDLAVQSLQLSASDFINKPVQREALDIALQRAKEKISLRRQIRDHTENLEARVEQATAELSKSWRQLETLYQFSQSVSEVAALSGILDLLKGKIHSVTNCQCRAFIVLNRERDGLVRCDLDPETPTAVRGLVELVNGLGQARALSSEELSMMLPSLDAETKILAFPIAKTGERAVAAALVMFPGEGAEEDLRLVNFILSQAAGAIKRAVLQEEELRSLRQLAQEQESFGEMVGRHEKMKQIYRLVESVAESDATVLIQGESGTGKELVAKRLHELSTRKNRPFVVINCAAYPQTLLESELFGYEKGAFTGAVSTRKGSFELAHGGTIFLDEIGEVSQAAQVKLLRVLQFKEFQRLGSGNMIRVDVRVVAATSRNLRREIELGNFREDLYYRLHVIAVMLPPLRERMSDLPMLVSHFLRALSRRSKKKILDIRPEAMRILMNYQWPGNIRELENTVEHAFVLAKEESLTASDLPSYLHDSSRAETLGDGLEDVERDHLLRVLEQCGGNKIEAARRLKISRSTLYRKLEQYRIDH